MRHSFLLSTALAICLLSACNSDQKSAQQRFDYIAEDLPFPRPVLAAQDTLPGVQPLPEAANERLNLQRAFFARDFAVLDAAVNELHEQYVAGKITQREHDILVKTVENTQLAGIDACKEWLIAKPQSYAAHWTCGTLWHEGAWVARSGEYADKVTPIRFTLMRERFERSNALLEKAVTLSPKPVEALVILAANHLASGKRDVAEDLLRRAEAIMPASPMLHETRIHYLQPEWGGSAEAVDDAIALAETAGVDQEALLYFRDNFSARPWNLSNPGAEKQYWEKALGEQPTFFRLKGLANYFHRMNNWRDGVPAASRLIEQYPATAEAYWMRAAAHEKLGNIPEALADYRMAAALGHDFSMQTLIRAYIQGGLSLPGKDWTQIDQVCRYGAGLGLSSAANCMGSIFWEGERVGGPFRTDIPQSFAWHLVGARGGYHNSQYDLGWLLLTGRAPGVGKDQAEKNGLFWLRRAAELDHQFAKKKLKEGQYAESEQVGPDESIAERVMDVLRILLVVF